jgi:hypothetical protein
MPKGQPTPDYKFRLLCRRCNSYLHTRISAEKSGDLVLWCGRCDVTAHDLDEEKP